MDEKSTIQNFGVTLEVESMQFSTSKDTNPVLGSMAYYGFIEEIWEVEYSKFFVLKMDEAHLYLALVCLMYMLASLLCRLQCVLDNLVL